MIKAPGFVGEPEIKKAALEHSAAQVSVCSDRLKRQIGMVG